MTTNWTLAFQAQAKRDFNYITRFSCLISLLATTSTAITHWRVRCLKISFNVISINEGTWLLWLFPQSAFSKRTHIWSLHSADIMNC